MTAGPERFLITGANGCIGAWAVRQLVQESANVVALDVSNDTRRLELLLDKDEMERVMAVRVDITDLEALAVALDEHAITNVIHLAAMQVPACRATPSLGARVNLVGTVNVFEAVARRKASMAPIVYASSIAAYGDVANAAVPSVDDGVPATMYGVFKRANEGAAAVFWRDHGVPSIGLRPHTVYGLGRDQGLTSAPTLAMLAAAAGKSYRIPYGGRSTFQYAPDVARAFIAAARSLATNASVHNLPGEHVAMSEVVAAIEAAAPDAAGSITWAGAELPFPDDPGAGSIATVIRELRVTPLHVGVRETISGFRSLLDAGALVAP